MSRLARFTAGGIRRGRISEGILEQDLEQHRFYMLLGVAFFLIVAIVITAGLRRGEPAPPTPAPSQTLQPIGE